MNPSGVLNMRQKHPKHPANSGRPHPPVLFIFENIERVDLALIFFSSLLVLQWLVPAAALLTVKPVPALPA